ncbi:hypothetical protein CERSUDRAFT_96947 [Gelatoporia subvermispora B]|uniref:Uncharacterized protein n=1 Tax=Ceriporiopsis subvermispora (strain B) TaxID=914234 RepID=M2R9C3_CERS8|nr:hypothetical protein CERSUDRAFT_96947 [Gelatoporia subvermispora B]
MRARYVSPEHGQDDDIEVIDDREEEGDGSSTAVEECVHPMKPKLESLLNSLASANPKRKPADNTPLSVYHKAGFRLQHELGPNVATMWLLRFGPGLADLAAGLEDDSNEMISTVLQW